MKKTGFFTAFLLCIILTVIFTSCKGALPPLLENVSESISSRVSEQSDISSEPSGEDKSEEPKSEKSEDVSEELSEELSEEQSEEQSEESSEEPCANTIVSVEDEYVYYIPERYASEGIKNIVRRARQIYEMKWTPSSDVTGYNGDFVFEANSEVYGIPYGQPLYEGMYVCWGCTFEQFVRESLKPTGDFYKTIYFGTEAAPYYSTDCSALVSYAWHTRGRNVTDTLVQFGDYNGNKLKSLQVGDALVKTGDGAHTVLVTGIKEDENQNIYWVEIIEQCPPLTTLTRYGDGELYTLDEMTDKYLNDGYYIYRNTDFRDTKIPYEHNCAVPIDGEYCEDCHTLSDYRSVEAESTEDGKKLRVTAKYGSDEKITGFYYTVTPYVFGNELYVDKNGEMVKILDKRTEIDGTVSGKHSYHVDGTTRFIWEDLSSLTYLRGTIYDPEKFNVGFTDGINSVATGKAYNASSEFIINASAFDGKCTVTVYAVTEKCASRKLGTVTVCVE